MQQILTQVMSVFIGRSKLKLLRTELKFNSVLCIHEEGVIREDPLNG